MSKIEHEVGSGNVYADLGHPDAEAQQIKARLVSVIGRLIKDQGLTQTAAAERIGMAQPDVSRMLKGQFRSVSVEKLLRCLMALGRNVGLTISPASAVDARGELRISEAQLAPPPAERPHVLDTTMVLTETQCRWPVGDPASADFHFCNNERAAGWPYCEQHSRNVMAPVSKDRGRNVHLGMSRTGRWPNSFECPCGSGQMDYKPDRQAWVCVECGGSGFRFSPAPSVAPKSPTKPRVGAKPRVG